ncbi:MAG: hypothetical protein P9L91_02965 [Candidatus Zophobacter franzmannii]|nr:hypothetical protein [Candidatus Zophobacter franzmannii]
MKRIIFTLVLISLGLVLNATKMTETITEPDTLTIGTPIDFVIRFSPPVDSAFVEVPDTLTTFDVIGNLPLYEADKLSGIKMILTPFETGQLPFPSINVMTWDEEILEQHQTRHQYFMVRTVLPDSGAVLVDISEPVTVRLNFWDYLLIISSIALLVLIIWGITKIPRKDVNKPKYEKPEVIIPAWKTALESLEELKSKQLIEKGDYLSYYFELSSILRWFIEDNFGINAAEMTTYEINDALSDLEVEVRPEIKNYLLNCDMKKYAKQIPTMEEADSSYYWLHKYLTEVKQIELSKIEDSESKEGKNV